MTGEQAYWAGLGPEDIEDDWKRETMAKVTRKLLVVEWTEPEGWRKTSMEQYIRIHLPAQGYVLHKLPSAEELGRVALRDIHTYQDGWSPTEEQRVGQRILDALATRTEGG